MPGDHTQNPILIVEEELQTPFFHDERRASLLYEGGAAQLPEGTEIGARLFIYRSALRLIAEQRHQERTAMHQKMGSVALENTYEQELRALGRRLSMLNQAEIKLEELRADPHPDERKQYDIAILENILKAPKKPKLITDTPATPVHGVITVAPTGFGKTTNAAKALQALGVGNKLSNLPETHDHPPKACYIVPTLELAGQLQETTNALRQILGNEVKISTFHSGNKDTSGNVVITVADSVNRHLDNNKLNEEQQQPFDIYVNDEAHKLLEPQTQATLLGKMSTRPILAFTATPQFNEEEKDVRLLFPYTVEDYSLYEAVEAGILNDALLYLFSLGYDDCTELLQEEEQDSSNLTLKEIMDLAAENAVIQFIQPLLEQGKRGMIFCSPGEKEEQSSYFARRLAKKLSKRLPNFRTEAIGRFDSNSDKLIKQFKNKEIDVLTTVLKGHEGLDCKHVDFVIINRRGIWSKLMLAQMLGRGTRKNDEHPRTTYAQFATPLEYEDEKIALIHEVFGLKLIQQAAAIGSRRNTTNNSSSDKEHVQLSSFLRRIADRIEGKRIGEALISFERQNNNHIPDDYIFIDNLIEGYGTTERSARRYLRKMGIAWKGKFEVRDEQRALLLYFPPESKQLIEEHFAKDDAIYIQDIATETGYSVDRINETAKKLHITTKVKIKGKDAHNACTPYEEQRIKNELLPVIQEGDATVNEIVSEFKLSKNAIRTLCNTLRIAPTLKVKPGATAKRALSTLDKEDYERFKEYLTSIPIAHKTDKYQAQLARALGVSVRTLHNLMTEKERQSGTQKRVVTARGSQQILVVWPESLISLLQERKHTAAQPGVTESQEGRLSYDESLVTAQIDRTIPIHAKNPGENTTLLLTREEVAVLSKQIEAGEFAKEALSSSERLLELAEHYEDPRLLELDLQTLIAQGERATETFLARNQGLVRVQVQKFIHRSGDLSFEDLLQEGNMGLLKAVRMFDYKKDFTLSTYANHWIRQHLQRAAGNQAQRIRIPVHVYDNQQKVRIFQRDFAQQHHREPTTDEIVKGTQLKEAQVEWAIKSMKQERGTISLDGTIDDNEALHIVNAIPDPSPSPLDTAIRNIVTEAVEIEQLKQNISKILSKQEYQIISLLYFDTPNHTQKKIAQNLGVSTKTLKKHEKNALEKLKRHFNRGELL